MDMEEYKEFSLTVPMYSKETKVELECKDCEEKEYEIKKNRAVALIGDRFYHSAFLPATELEKSYSYWENTLHDGNHEGTTKVKGSASSDIYEFVGYNHNVTYDKDTKSMSMEIEICDNTRNAASWRGYVELCELAGQTANVSVSFMAKTKSMKVSDLPEGVDYESYGYSAEDTVTYIYDIKPQALSTVFQGACSDKDGCGIGKSHTSKEVDEMEKKKQEIFSRIKKLEEEA